MTIPDHNNHDDMVNICDGQSVDDMLTLGTLDDGDKQHLKKKIDLEVRNELNRVGTGEDSPENVRKASKTNRMGLYFSLVYYTLFFIVFVVFVKVAMDIADTRRLQFNDPTATQSFKLMLAYEIPTLIMSCSLCVFFFVFWEAPEVRARHRGNIVQFCFAAILVPVSRIFQASVRFQQTNLKLGSDEFIAWFLLARLSMQLASFTLLSAIVLRLKFMYEVLVKKELRPKYYTGLLFHLFIYCSVTWVPFWCTYNGSHKCNFQEFFVPLYVFNGTLTLQYLFYIVMTRKANTMFVDFQSNIRNFVVFTFTFYVPIIWASATDSFIAFSYVGLYLGPVLLWMFTLDNYLLVIIRVVGRRFGWSILNDYDLEGKHVRILHDIDNVEKLLDDEKLKSMFIEYSKKRCCQEQVEFIIAMKEYLNNVLDGEEKADSQYMIKQADDLISTFIATDSSMEVNLTSKTRDEILKVQSSGTHKYNSLFHKALNEIIILVSTNLFKDFIETPEFLEEEQRVLAENEANTRLYRNGLISQMPTSYFSQRNNTTIRESVNEDEMYSV